MTSVSFFGPVTLANATTISGAGTVTSTQMDIRRYSIISMALATTGTITGTITIEGSMDGVNCFNMGILPAMSPAGSAYSTFINISQTAAIYMRAKLVTASGSGTFTVIGGAKQ